MSDPFPPDDPGSPRLRIFDSHVHAWARWPYEPAVPDPSTRGSVEQLLWEMDRNGVDEAALVCASIGDNPDNLAYGAAAAASSGRLHLFADLDCPWSSTYHTKGAAGRLARLVDAYPLAGATHYVTPDNDGWLRSPEADAMVGVAEERGLLLSLALTPAWHSDLRVLAARHPGVVIVCHHLAGLRGIDIPTSRERDAVVASAELPNIWVKASGFHYSSARSWDHPWPDALAVLEVLVEHFGTSRLCWGSDYPASIPFCTYRQSLEAVRTHARFLEPAGTAAILGGNLAWLVARGGLAGAGR